MMQSYQKLEAFLGEYGPEFNDFIKETINDITAAS